MSNTDKAGEKILTDLARGLDAIFPPATPESLGTAEDYNKGARVADDCFCSGCGARGYRGLCPQCQSDANEAGR